MRFNYQTETTVKDFLKVSISEIEKDLKYEKRMQELLKEDYGTQKIDLYENFLKYHAEVKSIIENNKLKPNKRISISFVPVMKKVKTDSKDLSKVGGIPFCFLKARIVSLLKNKEKFFDHLRKEYPKDNNGNYLTFVGDIDSTHPTNFINEVMPKLGKNKNEKTNVIFRKDGYSTGASSKGSLFIDQNVVSMSSSQTNGTWVTKKYLFLDKFSDHDLELYSKYVAEFLKKEVKAKYYCMDKFELTSFESWIPQIEVLTDLHSYSFDTFSNLPKERQVLKLFGYPESQQSIYPYFCTNGYFGPRLLSPFISIFNSDVDVTIQVYSDFITNNELQEYNSYLKVDISCT